MVPWSWQFAKRRHRMVAPPVGEAEGRIWAPARFRLVHVRDLLPGAGLAIVAEQAHMARPECGRTRLSVLRPTDDRQSQAGMP